MIRSMTGFGRGEYNDGKRSILVEIKSVNHRYMDLNVKLYRKYGFLEEHIRGKLKESVKRGKLDISVTIENLIDSDSEIKLNSQLAKQYYDCLLKLKEEFDFQEEINLRLISSQPEVLKYQPALENEEEIIAAALKATEIATENLEIMRKTEGNKLREDLILKGEKISNILSEIEGRTLKTVSEYKDKLRERIKELIGSEVNIPEDRILLEAAIFADKCAIDEEITRLKSHLIQLENILRGQEKAVGKKLDFLVQEMNREANTIGSKANDIFITDKMLSIKAEIEKIREQVQNIE